MIEKINELEHILNRIKEDNVVTPNEIKFLQDWVDENGIEFCENDKMSNEIIILQKVLDDCEISTKGIESLRKLFENVNKD